MTDTPSPRKPAILALAGYAGAGKDTFAGLLKDELATTDQRVLLVPSGDLIRQYVRDHDLGDPGDRAVLRHTVDVVAQTHGYTYWLEQSIAQAAAGVINVLLYPGLRQVVEVEFLHRRGDQIVIIDVPLATRYQRSQRRARPGDDISFETFKANEEAERAGSAQQIDAVVAAADIIITNDGTLEQLGQVAATMAGDFPGHLAKTYTASAINSARA